MDKTIKVGVLTGVVASMVFVYFLDPILRAFGDTVMNVSDYVVTGLVDSLYKKSALGVAKDPSLSIYSMLVGVMVGVSSGALLVLIKRRTGKDRTASANRFKVFVPVVFSILIPLVLFYQLWVMMFQYEIVSSFDQHVRILTPYVEEKELQFILSDFARMESESDYKAVYEKLNKIARDENIKLPSNPSYGVWAI